MFEWVIVDTGSSTVSVMIMSLGQNMFVELFRDIELIWLALNREEELLLGVITEVITGQLRIVLLTG